MRPNPARLRTLARLDLQLAAEIAAAGEAVRRQQAAVRQTGQQSRLLAAYRDRLAASRESGPRAAVMPAGQLRRVGHFMAASLAAQAQVEAAAAAAPAQLAQAIAVLAGLEARRRVLAEIRLRLERLAARAAAQALDRAAAPRRPAAAGLA